MVVTLARQLNAFEFISGVIYRANYVSRYTM